MPIATEMFTEFLEENVKDLTAQMPWMKDRKMVLIGNMKELSDFIDEAIKKGRCALDLETTGLNSRIKNTPEGPVPLEKIVGYCLSYDIVMGVYVPVAHQAGSEFNLPEKEVLQEIKRLCAHCVTIYHHGKFDMAFLKNNGIVINDREKFEDTLLLARLFDAGQKNIGLKDLSAKLLNQPMIELSGLTKGSHRIDLVSPKIAVVYGASDAICTLQLYEFFMSQQIIRDQTAVYKIEKMTLLVVIRMESNLFKIDTKYLQEAKDRTLEIQKNIEKEVYQIAGQEFNLGSPIQMGKILFEDLGYKYPEKSKTKSGQWATDESTLKKISSDYPLVKKILEYRGLEKSVSTYISNLLENHDEDGCIKLGFNQAGTETGRFSSPGGEGIKFDGYCGVNIQSIPKITEGNLPNIRSAFVTRPGFKIAKLDYSGEELRVAANISGEPRWIEAFLSGADLHAQTAKTVFHKTEITDEERKSGKILNFQTLYGSGPMGIAQVAGVSPTEAKRMLYAFFEGLPRLKKWIEVEIARARRNKYVKTAFGRIRPLHIMYDSGDMGLMAHADRCAVNTIIQGSSADIMKTSLVRCQSWINSNNFENDIRMLITVHDEIVFEIREEILKDVVPVLCRIMELTDILQGILKWPVPLVVDPDYGDSWGAKGKFFKDFPELKDKKIEVSFVSQSIPSEVKKTPEVQEQVSVQELPVESGVKDVTTDPSDKTETVEPVSPEPVTGNSDVIPPSNTSPEVVSDEKPVAVMEMGPEDVNPAQDKVIYTLRRRDGYTLRLLNTILAFLDNEEKVRKEGCKKVPIAIRDKDGNSFLVSDLRYNREAFLTLARFFGL